MSYSESVLTEDFANKFNETIVPPDQLVSNPILGYKSDLDQDSVFTEDMEPKDSGINFDDKDPYNIERKYQEILSKRKNRGNTYQSTPYQQGYSQYIDPYKHVMDDQSTVYDDYSMAIHQKRATIQKDIELERREKTRMRSMSPLGLNNNWRNEPFSPRETFEQKIHDLDNLSSSVKKATQEHQQLCRDLDEMKSQLRKNQADIRFSERMARENEEKVEFINKEFRDAERRRDQIIRQVDLVNEELMLKRTKLKSLDSQINREMTEIRRMERFGIDKEEIENILAERDELYQIVKKQEEVQLEKYELAKQMDLMRDGFQNEQDRAIKQIQSLEDELDASLRKIKQLQFDREEMEVQLNHTRHHLCQAEDEICQSAREVSELRGEYQLKIKKKLEEYEQDKERVDKELKKLEEEKSLDQANLKGHIEQIRIQLKNTEHERQDLTDLVADLEKHLKESNEERKRLEEDNEEKLRQLNRDKEREINELQASYEREQNLILEDEKIKFGQEKNRLQRQMDDEMDHLLRNIELKDKEILHLQNQVKEQEQSQTGKSDQQRRQHELQLKQERQNHDQKYQKLYQELETLKDNNLEQVKKLKFELDRTKSSLLDRDSQILDLKKKLTDSQSDIKRINSENLARFKKFKETFKEEIVKSLKLRYEQKMDEELVKVKNEFERKYQKLQQEKITLENHNKKNNLILHKIVKTVVHEINQESKKMAVLLNVEPRKVNTTKSVDDFSKSDNIITAALANLEACGSETRSLVHELEAKIKSMIDELDEKDKKIDGELRQIRKQLESEKNKDVAIIREKLTKEHIRQINKMAKSSDIGLKSILEEKEREIMKLKSEREIWKEKAAGKIAEKFDKINQKKISDIRHLLMKKERELRQIKSIGRQRSLSPTGIIRPKSISPVFKRNSSGGKSSGYTSRVMSRLNLDCPSDLGRPGSMGVVTGNSASTPARVIGSLQDNLQQLRLENTQLRQQLSRTTSSYDNNNNKIDSSPGSPLQRQSRWNKSHWDDNLDDSGINLRLSRSCSRSRE